MGDARAVAVAMLLLAGCGGGDGDEGPTAAPGSEGGEAQPSLLDAIDDLGGHGTFVIEAAPNELGGIDLDGVTGRYLAQEGRPTRTVVDLDLALVSSEIARLVTITGPASEIEPFLVDSVVTERTVVTDELQIGLADVLLQTGTFGAGGALAIDPGLAFSTMDGDGDEADVLACMEAFRALRAEVSRRLLDDLDDLRGDWQPDQEQLAGSALDHIEEVCGYRSEPAPYEVTLRRSDRAVEVVAGDTTVFAVRVEPGAGEPPSIDGPTASLVDTFGRFFVAIDRCGVLPHVYSDFMAGNSYTGPEDPLYSGPGPFVSALYCADDVPG